MKTTTPNFYLLQYDYSNLLPSPVYRLLLSPTFSSIQTTPISYLLQYIDYSYFLPFPVYRLLLSPTFSCIETTPISYLLQYIFFFSLRHELQLLLGLKLKAVQGGREQQPQHNLQQENYNKIFIKTYITSYTKIESLLNTKSFS